MADSIRPAYLEIVEKQPGLVDVIWKVPKVPGLPNTLAPALPPSFKPSSPRQMLDTPDAMIYKWSMIGEPLAGQTIRIEGLDSFTMDALLRIELTDGTVHRSVLKPTEPARQLPAGSLKPAQGGWTFISWIYPLLFMLAFFFSLTPAARKKGILLCSIALTAGSLCGHAVGGRLPHRQRGLTDSRAKKVIEGLMLYTYRAFILEEDEAVYDALARSVDGTFLQNVYLQNRQVLKFDDPESAASLVDRLDVKSIKELERNGDGSYTILADWDVYGSVFHWEHVHFRCNAFRARVTIVPADGYWKISRLDVLDVERVI